MTMRRASPGDLGSALARARASKRKLRPSECSLAESGRLDKTGFTSHFQPPLHRKVIGDGAPRPRLRSASDRGPGDPRSPRGRSGRARRGRAPQAGRYRPGCVPRRPLADPDRRLPGGQSRLPVSQPRTTDRQLKAGRKPVPSPRRRSVKPRAEEYRTSRQELACLLLVTRADQDVVRPDGPQAVSGPRPAVRQAGDTSMSAVRRTEQSSSASGSLPATPTTTQSSGESSATRT